MYTFFIYIVLMFGVKIEQVIELIKFKKYCWLETLISEIIFPVRNEKTQTSKTFGF